MISPPEQVHTVATACAVIRLKVPRSEIQQVMGPAFGELFASLAAQGITPAGPLFTHHFRMDPDIFDFEAGVAVRRPVEPAGRVLPSELPGRTVICSTYSGGYEGLGNAWGELKSWIAQQPGLQTAPDLWECYTTGPESSSNPADWRTELNQPLA